MPWLTVVYGQPGHINSSERKCRNGNECNNSNSNNSNNSNNHGSDNDISPITGRVKINNPPSVTPPNLTTKISRNLFGNNNNNNSNNSSKIYETSNNNNVSSNHTNSIEKYDDAVSDDEENEGNNNFQGSYHAIYEGPINSSMHPSSSVYLRSQSPMATSGNSSHISQNSVNVQNSMIMQSNHGNMSSQHNTLNHVNSNSHQNSGMSSNNMSNSNSNSSNSSNNSSSSNINLGVNMGGGNSLSSSKREIYPESSTNCPPDPHYYPNPYHNHRTQLHSTSRDGFRDYARDGLREVRGEGYARDSLWDGYARDGLQGGVKDFKERDHFLPPNSASTGTHCPVITVICCTCRLLYLFVSFLSPSYPLGVSPCLLSCYPVSPLVAEHRRHATTHATASTLRH